MIPEHTKNDEAVARIVDRVFAALNEHSRTIHSTITGEPEYFLVPVESFREVFSRTLAQSLEQITVLEPDDRVFIPEEVVRLHVLEEKGIVRSWREYLGLTQKEMARRLDISQPAYAKFERPDANLKIVTRRKIAAALGVEVEQLIVD